MHGLKIGIANYEEMKARTMRIAKGEERPDPDGPKVWFTSTESFARILSEGNREMLRAIFEHQPESLSELAHVTGRAKSNLSRTLKKMAEFGIVGMESHGRRRKPKVLVDRITLDLSLVHD